MVVVVVVLVVLVVLPVVPVQWQCRGSALYRSGNLLIITPQDSVLSSNNTNSSVLFSV